MHVLTVEESGVSLDQAKRNDEETVTTAKEAVKRVQKTESDEAEVDNYFPRLLVLLLALASRPRTCM